jgi:hypothetical protein
MRNTKILLATVGTFIITYLFISTIVYLMSELTFKESSTSMVTAIIAMIFGWIPSVFVAIDLEDQN